MEEINFSKIPRGGIIFGWNYLAFYGIRNRNRRRYKWGSEWLTNNKYPRNEGNARDLRHHGIRRNSAIDAVLAGQYLHTNGRKRYARARKPPRILSRSTRRMLQLRGTRALVYVAKHAGRLDRIRMWNCKCVYRKRNYNRRLIFRVNNGFQSLRS